MFLVDTNVWLELLLEQDKADEVRRFLGNTDAADLAISEFTVYSIGIILCKLHKEQVFEDFVADTLQDSRITRARLDVDEMGDLLAAHLRFGLDFDDAYQYVSAVKHEATVVSFDSDFDRTDRGRKTPAQALEP